MLAFVAEAEKVLIVEVHQAAKSGDFSKLSVSECSNFWLHETITQDLESESEFVAR